jgi:hypothetical protein
MYFADSTLYKVGSHRRNVIDRGFKRRDLPGNKAARFQNRSSPVRSDKEIPAIIAISCRAKSLFWLRTIRNTSSGGRAACRVDIFNCYVAARLDAEYGSGAWKKKQDGENHHPDISFVTIGHFHHVTLFCMIKNPPRIGKINTHK